MSSKLLQNIVVDAKDCLGSNNSWLIYLDCYKLVIKYLASWTESQIGHE